MDRDILPFNDKRLQGESLFFGRLSLAVWKINKKKIVSEVYRGGEGRILRSFLTGNPRHNYRPRRTCEITERYSKFHSLRPPLHYHRILYYKICFPISTSYTTQWIIMDQLYLTMFKPLIYQFLLFSNTEFHWLI